VWQFPFAVNNCGALVGALVRLNPYKWETLVRKVTFGTQQKTSALRRGFPGEQSGLA